jgi:hypothetical protein
MTSILKVSEIQDPTNSNTALTIDSAGRVLMPVKPVFFANGQSLGWISNPGSTTVITGWDTSNSNYINQGGMSYSSGAVTVPVAGVYRVTSQIMGRLSSGQYVIIRPTKNGTVQNNGQLYAKSATSIEHTVSSNILVNCLANDVIDIRVLGSGGDYYLEKYSNFGIELVS